MTETQEMTVIERAARAVADYTGQRLPPQGDIITCEGIARAVLQAIREPSDAVTDVGVDMLTERGCNPLSGDAEAVWQAMIDAALSE
jgi:hypothetical protein